MNTADLDKMKGFAERGSELYQNLLKAFQNIDLEDMEIEYLKIAMMAVCTDVYNQGYSEGSEAGWQDHEKLHDIGLL